MTYLRVVLLYLIVIPLHINTSLDDWSDYINQTPLGTLSPSKSTLCFRVKVKLSRDQTHKPDIYKDNVTSFAHPKQPPSL